MVEAKFRVRLTPRARQDRLIGWRDDVLWAQVSAPPVEGQANEALVRLLAQGLKVPRGQVRLLSGQRSRQKVVAVEGLTAEEIKRRLGRLDRARSFVAKGRNPGR